MAHFDAKPPQVAVVVATRNRAALLERLLRALAGAASSGLDHSQLEVVVVDDASTDGTAQLLAGLASELPYKLAVLRHPTPTGPAAARDDGWRVTAAPKVLFTDDDCVPDPGWLSAMAGGLDGADVVAGTTTLPLSGPRPGRWSYWLEEDASSGHFAGCNSGYRREALEAVGGFDGDAFRYRRNRGARALNGEDTDLAWRVLASGRSAAAVPAAVVRHDVSPSDWRAELRNRRRLEGIVLLAKRHPGVRRRFGYRFGFVHISFHPAALAVSGSGAMLAVALAAKRARLPVAAGFVLALGWYLRLFRILRASRQGSRWGWLVDVPLGIISDTYGALVMLRSSIRYRTLVL